MEKLQITYKNTYFIELGVAMRSLGQNPTEQVSAVFNL